MLVLAVISYGLAAVGFLILSVLLWFGRGASPQFRWLIAASVVTALWALSIVLAFSTAWVTVPRLAALDGLRAAIWLVFLTQLLPSSGAGRLPLGVSRLLTAGGVLCFGYLLFQVQADTPAPPARLFLTLLVLSLLGLLALEQVYRNADPMERRVLGWLGVAIGVAFAYDLFVFAEAVLVGGFNIPMWLMRGFVAAFSAPLIAVAAKRHRDLARDLFVSRQMVFYSATLLGTGVYLLAMAAGGYFIRQQGGEWGSAWQALFSVAALAVLLVILFSSQAHGRLKVFLAKHFYRNRYDYREEWLRLIGTLSFDASGAALKQRCVKALADILGSPGGELWLLAPDDEDFEAVAGWNIEVSSEALAGGQVLAEFLARTQWVIDTDEYDRDPGRYENAFGALEQPLPAGRIIVPLIHQDSLVGIVVLLRPAGMAPLNFEDHDLLKTAGRQVAVFVMQESATQALAETRQFEAVNKLSTFLMHDLKNLVAQQDLLLGNAPRYKERPEFVNDMIRTVESSVLRMKRLLAQLERGQTELRAGRVDVSRVVVEVANECSDRKPAPRCRHGEPIWVAADRDRIRAVITHAVRNAQDATDADGSIELKVARITDRVFIDIRDTGIGMDAEFVKKRLFRPFDTTKGARGMGIGAYQIREFVREAGGDVVVESAVGEGTLFRVWLPALDSDPEQAARVRTDGRTSPETAGS